MSEIEQPNWIAGVWRRLGAFVIDVIALSVLGYLLGLLIADFLMQLGPQGRTVGFAMSVAYFGIQESRFGNGQTLGKRLVGLAVVDAQGQFLSLSKSLFRAAVFLVPVSLNNAQLPADVGMVWIFLAMMVVWVGLLSFIYLLIFNRTTRQAPYDLLVRAFVVKTDLDAQPSAPVWRGHYGVLAGLCLAVVLGLFLTERYWQPPVAHLDQSDQVQQALESEPEVLRTWVTATPSGQAQATELSQVSINVLMNRRNTDDPELAKKLATMAVFADASVADRESILIQLMYGYDIVFSAYWRSNSYYFAPSDL
ncbi:hypothetical protein BGP77_01780 [Saccharospirillum sp. MSK14-1]|uniref:RDD family protein n=1 Tax=Saccharospirillum sp. MSK14-1 TaxID=1897632 RepID=UPI000D34C853|nr:RDD family protein [Saccharospirillum sp. MSK14-1]PTY36074.1 hypothetical protein BGP77_01780 [Saccharospirillum sp. MSK14-1]